MKRADPAKGQRRDVRQPVRPVQLQRGHQAENGADDQPGDAAADQDHHGAARDRIDALALGVIVMRPDGLGVLAGHRRIVGRARLAGREDGVGLALV